MSGRTALHFRIVNVRFPPMRTLENIAKRATCIDRIGRAAKARETLAAGAAEERGRRFTEPASRRS